MISEVSSCLNYLKPVLLGNGTQILCFKGGLIWNTVPNKFKNLGNIDDFKKHIKDWKPTTCSCKLCL